MAEPESDLRVHMRVGLAPSAAFDAFIGDLATGLLRRGMTFRPGAQGSVVQGGREVARVVAWEPGARIRLEWRAAEWEGGSVTPLELEFEPTPEGTRISIRFRGWGQRMKLDGPELAGWLAQAVAATLLQAAAPAAVGDWITDSRARRPSGAAARRGYRDPTFHRPHFKLLLAGLHLSPQDYLLEICCGGGAFMREALQSGCRGAALDHSLEMVRLARAENRDSVRAGRFEAVHAEADRIPFADGLFTCAATTNVFGFIDDPRAALSEIHRTLRPGGRLVLFTPSRELLGTPAAPEPMASRFHFYEDGGLGWLALEAGFVQARIDRPDLEPFARGAGLAEDEIAPFRGEPDAQLLTARKG